MYNNDKRETEYSEVNDLINQNTNDATTEANTASVACVKKEGKFRKMWRNNWEGWMFTLPLVIGLGLFTVYPMIQSLIWAFQDIGQIANGGQGFIGFKNFADIFAGEYTPYFWAAFRNTSFFTFLSVPITLISSYFLALLVNMKIKGVGLFRVIYYLPTVIPGIVSGLLWNQIFNTTVTTSGAPQGLFNTILGAFGTHSEFFDSSNWAVALGSIFLMNMWSIGAGMVLWLSAFKSIPGQLYEAAKIDGAGRLQSLIHVTIPMSMSMIFFNIVTMFIGNFQYNGTFTFAPANAMGNNNSMYLLSVFIHHTAWGGGTNVTINAGVASALSWVLLLFVAVVTAILFGLRKFLYMGDD